MSAQAVLRRADGRPVRVLVVDDESTLSELLAMALRYEGWEIRTAADGFLTVGAVAARSGSTAATRTRISRR